MEEGKVREGFLEEVMLIRDAKDELIGHHVNQGQSAHSGESGGNTRSHFRIPNMSWILMPEHFPQCLGMTSWQAPGLQINRPCQRIVNLSASPKTKCHNGRIWAYGLAATPSAQADLAPTWPPTRPHHHHHQRPAQQPNQGWWTLGKQVCPGQVLALL